MLSHVNLSQLEASVLTADKYHNSAPVQEDTRHARFVYEYKPIATYNEDVSLSGPDDENYSTYD